MRRGDGEDGKVVAVIGDGAMTGGVAFEAIHQAGGLGTPLVVVLNDNGMSIAPNVGALSRYFNRVRLEPGPVEGARGRRGAAHEAARPGSARRSSGSARSSRSRSRRSGRPGLFWEELDWAYMGVIDGHDVRALRRALRAAFEAERPGRRARARPSRARASRPPRTAAWRAWRSGTPPSPTRSPSACPRRPSRPSKAARAAVHAGLRRGAGGRVRARRARGRHHRRDELRHRA